MIKTMNGDDYEINAHGRLLRLALRLVRQYQSDSLDTVREKRHPLYGLSEADAPGQLYSKPGETPAGFQLFPLMK